MLLSCAPRNIDASGRWTLYRCNPRGCKRSPSGRSVRRRDGFWRGSAGEDSSRAGGEAGAPLLLFVLNVVGIDHQDNIALVVVNGIALGVMNNGDCPEARNEDGVDGQQCDEAERHEKSADQTKGETADDPATFHIGFSFSPNSTGNPRPFTGSPVLRQTMNKTEPKRSVRNQ